MELKFEGFEMQKLNVPMDGANSRDIAVVIKMSKMPHFLYFLLMIAKDPVTVLAKHLSAPERFRSENATDYCILN